MLMVRSLEGIARAIVPGQHWLAMRSAVRQALIRLRKRMHVRASLASLLTFRARFTGDLLHDLLQLAWTSTTETSLYMVVISAEKVDSLKRERKNCFRRWLVGDQYVAMATFQDSANGLRLSCASRGEYAARDPREAFGGQADCSCGDRVVDDAAVAIQRRALQRGDRASASQFFKLGLAQLAHPAE